MVLIWLVPVLKVKNIFILLTKTFATTNCAMACRNYRHALRMLHVLSGHELVNSQYTYLPEVDDGLCHSIFSLDGLCVCLKVSLSDDQFDQLFGDFHIGVLQRAGLNQTLLT